MTEINITYREATIDDALSIVYQIEASAYNREEVSTEEAIEGTIKRWKGYIEGTHTKVGKAPRVIYLAFRILNCC